jgi:hypothetical protein
MVAPGLLCLGVGLGGCTGAATTPDGTRIVAFAPRKEPTRFFDTDRATYEFTLSAWTDRMPTATPGRDGKAGYPLYVALSVSGLSSDATWDSLQVVALSLWNPAGDSLIGAFSLVLPDGSPPWVYAAKPARQSELTNLRTRPRYRKEAPDEPVVPLLLLSRNGREMTLRLPSVPITAAY